MIVQAICRGITEGGVLTADRDLLRQAARRMLIGVLSCRENRSQSGVFARIAGEAIGASLQLPNMATEEFLSCLSRGALETAARAEGVNVAPRVVHTRERMVKRFKDGTFVYPGALFRLTPEELEAAAEPRHGRSGWVDPVIGEDGEAAKTTAPSRRTATNAKPASTMTMPTCRSARSPDPTATPAPATAPGQVRFIPRSPVMTHLSPGGGAMAPPPLLLSRQALDVQIDRRRARLAELEAEMIAACEAAALGTRPQTNAAPDRERWNRATWQRYLAAAMRLEAVYGPRMRRLRQEIGQLERLMTLPIVKRHPKLARWRH